MSEDQSTQANGEDDRQVVYTKYESKVYHYADAGGDPVCGIGDIGSGSAETVHEREPDVDRRVLCLKCEKTQDNRSMAEISQSVRELANLSTVDEREGVSQLTMGEMLEIESILEEQS